MVFHWSLSDSKSPQVSRTLLSILAVLKNAVVWMVSTRPLTSKSSSPFSNPLVTVPNALITIGIFVTCMFHSFFQFSSKVEVLIFLFTFFQFYSVVSRDSKVNYFANSFFLLLIIIKSGLLPGIRWSFCMLKSRYYYYYYNLLLYNFSFSALFADMWIGLISNWLYSRVSVPLHLKRIVYSPPPQKGKKEKKKKKKKPNKNEFSPPPQ